MHYATPAPLAPAADLEGSTAPEELQDAAGAQSLTPPAAEEEALVTDARAGLTPAQMVERKLVSLLKSNPLPVSHVMAASRPLRVR